ncbi:MAG: hypothetical protein J0H43_11460, partial [Actinobacteria bacterium]|nr:hypothetical protein [Actinomycetota bacterium]
MSAAPTVRSRSLLTVLLLALAAALVLSMGAAVSIGSVGLSLGTVWNDIAGHLHLAHRPVT